MGALQHELREGLRHKEATLVLQDRSRRNNQPARPIFDGIQDGIDYGTTRWLFTELQGREKGVLEHIVTNGWYERDRAKRHERGNVETEFCVAPTCRDREITETIEHVMWECEWYRSLRPPWFNELRTLEPPLPSCARNCGIITHNMVQREDLGEKKMILVQAVMLQIIF